ncbi:glycerophosphoinositol inositolphosphodiesterase GDPD2 [Melanotaenia boesemani]|uniref:glycerophosphoinositol inositolphosphodiesterase GDPD2 n=1 Tax=Melanotaenia boesemani TaxID=1250792 RepID=UPI001C04E405|nr:glycerophosphoinositol inositolphosphodiesterase GDPD2 [Melanotaenia boesemani]
MCQDNGCLRVCSRGLYSCYWRKSSDNSRKCSCCWFSVVTVVSLLSLCWMYICLVTFNDREEVNSEAFSILKRWVNWFMVVIIISAVLTIYCVLLLVFALIQIALREQLDLHMLHKIFLFLGVIFITLLVIGISLKWQTEWPTVPLSLQAMAPFLQFGAVGALTLLSSFVFQGFHMANKGSKFLIALVFLTVSAAIFLCPLVIRSPCLIELKELPKKPKLIGHRGAPMLAPENTMMSFHRSIKCGVTAFETDVQLSKDRIPFLMHDNKSEFLLRTTDVKSNFHNRSFEKSTELNFEELQSLNAGKWFIETDPFQSVSQLSEQDKKTAENQTIPSLLELLHLAKQYNISVIFDLKSPDQENDTKETVETIKKSGIDPSLVLWLPPSQREYVNRAAPDFIQVYNNESEMSEKGGSYLNVKYSKLSMDEISELQRKNVTVNLWVVNERWLFSLLWCAGASSVTTNSCHLLKDVKQPDWTMSPSTYRMIWIMVDVASFILMIVLYIFQRKKSCSCCIRGGQGNTRPAQYTREMSPFLPS